MTEGVQALLILVLVFYLVASITLPMMPGSKFTPRQVMVRVLFSGFFVCGYMLVGLWLLFQATRYNVWTKKEQDEVRKARAAVKARPKSRKKVSTTSYIMKG